MEPRHTTDLRIKPLREMRGISQREAARRSGIDPATWNRIENNNGNPTLATLETIADVLRVKLVDLLHQSRPYPPPRQSTKTF